MRRAPSEPRDWPRGRRARVRPATGTLRGSAVLSVRASFGPQVRGAERAAVAAAAPARLAGAGAALPAAGQPRSLPPRAPAPGVGHRLPPPALHAVPAARAARARVAARLGLITSAAVTCTSVSRVVSGCLGRSQGETPAGGSCVPRGPAAGSSTSSLSGRGAFPVDVVAREAVWGAPQQGGELAQSLWLQWSAPSPGARIKGLPGGIAGRPLSYSPCCSPGASWEVGLYLVKLAFSPPPPPSSEPRAVAEIGEGAGRSGLLGGLCPLALRCGCYSGSPQRPFVSSLETGSPQSRAAWRSSLWSASLSVLGTAVLLGESSFYLCEVFCLVAVMNLGFILSGRNTALILFTFFLVVKLFYDLLVHTSVFAVAFKQSFSY